MDIPKLGEAKIMETILVGSFFGVAWWLLGEMLR